jgi:hypothetical protein
MLFIRTKNTVGARSAQWPRANIGGRRRIPRAAAIRADEKHIHTQSAILDKSTPGQNSA